MRKVDHRQWVKEELASSLDRFFDEKRYGIDFDMDDEIEFRHQIYRIKKFLKIK